MPKSFDKPQPRRVSLNISARAWDQVQQHATRYGISTDDVLDDMVIEMLPFKPGAPVCTLCNKTGHRAKKCPDQVKFPGMPEDVPGTEL